MNLCAVGILACLAVGNCAGRKIKELEGYFLAGRQPLALLVVGPLKYAAVLQTSVEAASAARVYRATSL